MSLQRPNEESSATIQKSRDFYSSLALKDMRDRKTLNSMG